MNSPFSPRILLLLLILLVTLAILVQIGILSFAFQKLGLSAETALGILLAALFAVVGSGTVRIEINQSFPLREAAEAHRALEARETTGSTVLLPDCATPSPL